MTYIVLVLLLLILLAVASVLWGADSRGLRDHPWEPLGS